LGSVGREGTAGSAGAGGVPAAGGGTASALGPTGSVFLNQFKGFNENPPDCFLVPALALRLPLRVTLDLCLDMIIMNNYILNEDINI
jgi:hypothetical protein